MARATYKQILRGNSVVPMLEFSETVSCLDDWLAGDAARLVRQPHEC